MNFTVGLHMVRFSPAAKVPAWRALLVLVSVIGPAATVFAQAKPVVTNQSSARTIAVRPVSPIEYFRELLAMKPDARERELARKSPAQREALATKIKEYEAMPAQERELKLRMTQLRWYLLPLMKQPPVERLKSIAAIPPADRELVESRLKIWDEIPAHLQKEFLDNETNISYFLRWESSTPEQRSKMVQTFPPERREQWANDLNRWSHLPVARRREMAGHFTQFFELNEKEKQKTLSALPEAERRQMEQTLQGFAKLPPEQRKKCMEAFQEFARMTPEQKNEFLHNAGRWQAMSSAERQAWREVMADSPPMPPPPSPAIMPPNPPGFFVSTNSSGVAPLPPRH